MRYFRWLQKYNAAGGALWVTARIFTDWPAVTSMLTGVAVGAAAMLEWGTQLGYSIPMAVGIAVAASMVWLIIGLRALFRRGAPEKPKMQFDYSYALAVMAPYVAKDEENEEGFFQPGVVWRNAGPAALKFYVDYFNVVIGDRTGRRSYNREGIIPRDCHKTFFYPAFSKEQLAGLGTRATGIVEYSVRYGHPEHGFIRVAKARLTATFRWDDKPAFIYLIEEELDTELKD